MKIILAIIGIFALGNYLTKEDYHEELKYKVRSIQERILLEQLEVLQQEVKILEEVYGPVNDWTNGTKHTPGFVRTAIKQHRTDAFEKLKCLYQRVCVAKKLCESESVKTSTSVHQRKSYLISRQDEVHGFATKVVTHHFKSIADTFQKLEQASSYTEIDKVLEEFDSRNALNDLNAH